MFACINLNFCRSLMLRNSHSIYNNQYFKLSLVSSCLITCSTAFIAVVQNLVQSSEEGSNSVCINLPFLANDGENDIEDDDEDSYIYYLYKKGK